MTSSRAPGQVSTARLGVSPVRDGATVITDKVLRELVPPAMEKARGGADAAADARAELIDAYDAQAAAGNHYRACVLAHYVATMSVSEPDEQMRWNRLALDHAAGAEPADVAGFMPSLLGSIGASALAVGDRTSALAYYERAATHLEALTDDDYGRMVRSRIETQLQGLRD